jgi:hypothetical protein
VPNWIPLKTGVENEIGVTQSWELPEFWELNHLRPSACTPFHAAYFPLHPGGIGRKILNRIAGDGNRPRKPRKIAPPIPRDLPVTGARLPFSSFGSFMKEIIYNLPY